MALIGAGRVATAFGVLLQRAGYQVIAGSGRMASAERLRRHLPFARFTSPEEAARVADVALFGVPDDLIAKACAVMARGGAFHPHQYAVHLSGSVGLDALSAAAGEGARVLSVHPLQSVPHVHTGVERLPGSAMAVTAASERAYAFGERLATAVGGHPFRLGEELKPLYHAAAVFASNYLVVVEAVAERLFRAAGVEAALPALEPLARTAFEATFERGPKEALTGPAARGDAGTVERNVRALAERAPDTVEAYIALARQAARLAERAGRLDEGARLRLEEALRRWS